MRFQEFDAFALQSYSFALRKTNSFFSLATVLLSLGIVALALLLNLATVSHLWLPRDQLPVLSSQSLSYPDALTSTLLCFASNDSENGTVPNIRILDQNLTELSFPIVTEREVQSQRPLLAAQIASPFGCIDLKGFTFSQNNPSLIIQVMSKSATLYVESISHMHILQQSESLFMKLTSTSNIMFKKAIRTIYAILTDTLLVNQSPEILNMFYYDASTIFTSTSDLPFQTNNTLFKFDLYYPIESRGENLYNNNKFTLSITRFNIGYIIGVVLSWVSIFALLCSFVVGPLMEKSLSLLQAQTLFDLQERLRSPSLPKFVLASLKRGLFPKEDAFVQLCGKLERLKDVAFALKVQKTLARLCPTGTRGKQSEVIASEHSFSHPLKEDFGVEVYSSKADGSQSNPFEEEEDAPSSNQGTVSRARKALLCWLDAGSDSVSVNYAGKGHGSRESLCVSVLFAVGFLAFLSLFGVFDISTAVDSFDVHNYATSSYRFQPNEIIFASNESAQVLVSYLDGNFKAIANLSLSSSPDCLTGLSSEQVAQVSDFKHLYCLEEGATLVSSVDPTQVITFYVDNINFQSSNLYIFHFLSPSPNTSYHPMDRQIFISSNFPGTMIYYEEVISLTSITSNSETYILTQFVPLVEVNNALTQLTGINIRLSSSQTVIQQTSTSVFDVVQNVWGFATICFTMLLMKLTKYINLRQKEKAVSPEKAEFRDSLCILLSKLHSLLNGRHKQELQTAKSYLKSSLFSIF